MAATDSPHHPDPAHESDEQGHEDVDPHRQLRMKVASLSEENQSLRLELGQEHFKLRKLERLRERAAEMQRAGHQAAAVELRAQKDIQEAEAFVEKSMRSAQNEKTRLLEQLQALEVQLQEASAREDELTIELRDTLNDTSRASWLVGETKRQAEDWKKEAGKLQQQAKQAEQRLQQSEQRRNEERAKLKTVATHLQSAAKLGAGDPAITKCLAGLDVDSVGSIDKLARVCTQSQNTEANRKSAKAAPVRTETRGKIATKQPSQGSSSRNIFGLGSRISGLLGRLSASSGKGASPGSGQKHSKKASSTSLESESQDVHQQVVLLVLVTAIAGMAAAKMLL